MLYDPKWEAPTKADPLSLDSLIAWLETQPRDKAYCYDDTGHCLLAQYFQQVYGEEVGVGGTYYTRPDGTDVDLPMSFRDIPVGGWACGLGRRFKNERRTFGAALERAIELRDCR
jgi:hypothetical protein